MMVSLLTHICVTRPQWITETWLDSNNHDLYNIPEHNMINDFRQKSARGGVSILLLESLCYKETPIADEWRHRLWFHWLKRISEKNIHIGVIYRPPNTPVSIKTNDKLGVRPKRHDTAYNKVQYANYEAELNWFLFGGVLSDDNKVIAEKIQSLFCQYWIRLRKFHMYPQVLRNS